VPADQPISPRALRALPKISLHNHLAGSVAAETAVELARTYDVALPDDRDARTLYDHASYEDLGHFLEVYDIVGSAVRTSQDFHRVTYEMLSDGARHGVLHREIFLSPSAHPEASYRTMLDGIEAGMADAQADHGITSRLIPAIHRQRSLGEAMELVQLVIDHRRDFVVGIGMDYSEADGPPHGFVDAYLLAKKAGLHRTAHSESGPPANITFLLDEMGVERIDHGYHVVTDASVLQRCVDDRVPFTCTPVSSDIGRYSGSGDGKHEKIAAMIAAGMVVSIDGDDPPMFGTNPTRDLQVLVDAHGYAIDQLLALTDNGIEAAWLDESDRADLRERARRQAQLATGLL
jgi:adenosine deaminase